MSLSKNQSLQGNIDVIKKTGEHHTIEMVLSNDMTDYPERRYAVREEKQVAIRGDEYVSRVLTSHTQYRARNPFDSAANTAWCSHCLQLLVYRHMISRQLVTGISLQVPVQMGFKKCPRWQKHFVFVYFPLAANKFLLGVKLQLWRIHES